MSEQTSQEPTMEEILASIRRIISEDEAPAEAGEAPPAQPVPEPEAAAAPEPEPAAEPEPAPEPEPVAAAPRVEPTIIEDEPEEEEDALELTQKVETVGDLDVLAPSAAEPAPPAPAAAPSPASTLVSERAATAAASAFGQLSAAIAMPREGRTLEDVVRELLTPLLQQWLDENLPRITQEAVEAEVARIARGRVG
jgi:cell pole-organizing protein PopZ